MADLHGLTANPREQSARKVRPVTFARTYFAGNSTSFCQVTGLISLTYLCSHI